MAETTVCLVILAVVIISLIVWVGVLSSKVESIENAIADMEEWKEKSEIFRIYNDYEKMLEGNYILLGTLRF